jgi:hypothetical protein
MPKELSFTEQLAYSTVRIETELSVSERGTGTGFFFQLPHEGDSKIPLMVTNKHVVEGALKGTFKLTCMAPDGGPDRLNHLTITLDLFEKRWIPHPDGVTDLCVMPIAPLLQELSAQKKPVFYRKLGEDIIPSKPELEALWGLEEVVMIGYPNGIWDEVNNFPIFRRGITATNPLFDWNDRPEFLIDLACFPGSSGSPVLLYNTSGFYTDKAGAPKAGFRVKLLGILYAGPQHEVSGEVKIVTVPTKNVPVAFSRIPNNLGIVIKSSKLLDFKPILSTLNSGTQPS